MTDFPGGRGSRAGYPHQRLRLVALTAVIIGVLLLAAAAFLLSYSGIHHIALQAGVAAQLARLYPLIFDAMLVIAGSAALALRGAGWWMRCYVWLSLLVLLSAVAAGDAIHAMNVTLPRQPARAAVAVTPWVLLLLGFGLWLAMLRQLRRLRTGEAAAAPAAAGPDGVGVTWAGWQGRAAQVGLDQLLEPRVGQPPQVAEPAGERLAVPAEADEASFDHSPYIVHESYPATVTAQDAQLPDDARPSVSVGGGIAEDPAALPGEAAAAGGGGLDAFSEPSPPDPSTAAPGEDPRQAPAESGQDSGDEGVLPPAGSPSPPAFDRMRSTPTPPHPTPSQD